MRCISSAPRTCLTSGHLQTPRSIPSLRHGRSGSHAFEKTSSTMHTMRGLRLSTLSFTSAREENFRQRRNPTKPNRAIVEAQVEDLQLSTSATFTRTLICQCGTAKENHVSRARELVLPSPSSPDCTLQSLVNQILTPKQSFVSCYCATCQKDTPHAKKAQVVYPRNQNYKARRHNRSTHMMETSVP